LVLLYNSLPKISILSFNSLRILSIAWLIPVIPATWEAEIRRIKVQPAQANSLEDLHLQNNQSKMDWRWLTKVTPSQAQSPEFKLQSYFKKRGKNRILSTAFKNKCLIGDYLYA
jgi:hypothetical protein